jgi:hypothetical protein
MYCGTAERFRSARELIGAPSPVVFLPSSEAGCQNSRQFYHTAPPQLRY